MKIPSATEIKKKIRPMGRTIGYFLRYPEGIHQKKGAKGRSLKNEINSF